MPESLGTSLCVFWGRGQGGGGLGGGGEITWFVWLGTAPKNQSLFTGLAFTCL